jgi:hypothetical protein
LIQPLVTLALAKGATTGTNWLAVAALAAWATVLIYIVIGLFAWRQVRKARKLREEQARPFVIVDFEPGFLVYLTVENLGRTMARDVRIQFGKPLETTLERPREIDETPLFREAIPALPRARRSACCSISSPRGWRPGSRSHMTLTCATKARQARSR